MKLSTLALVAWLGCGRIGFDEGDEGVSGPEFRSLCAFDKVTVIKNGIAVDDMVGVALQRALESGCGNAPLVGVVSQDDPGVLDADTNRPLIDPSRLAIIGGGEGPNRGIRYLLEADTPVVWSGTSTATIRERSTNRLLAEGPITATHDFVMVMVIVEAIGGLRVLSGQGFTREGTIASRLAFDQIAPTISTNSDVWTLIDWTDTDGATGATTNDTFRIVESGR
jgi:hypothetical protein